MKILLLGGGGREHALAWKLAQSPSCARLFAAPGNPGIGECAELVELDPNDHDAVVAFSRAHAIDLVVVGPEGPLVGGIADALRAAGIATFGPSAAAAQLEGSKGFTKELCSAVGIPTAAYERYDRLADAIDGLDGFGLPVVVKADGLAAGKGVTVAVTRTEAVAALEAIFDTPGALVVVEEFLVGEEVSLFALTDGTTVVPFGTAQDHKRVGDGDTGPNTGGMGAYSPATVLTAALQDRAMREIVEPTVAAMAARGTPFVGVLYAGLMLTTDGPQLIEYNARFGDPETQVLMPRFDGDLVALFDAVARGRLDEIAPPQLAERSAVTVVLAAEGYPGVPTTGMTVGNLDTIENALVFHAGTCRREDAIVASGGRVLTVTAVDNDFAQARARAYEAIASVTMAHGFYRSDIGWREAERSRI